MSLRQRGYLIENVERETRHIGRVLKLQPKEARTLVGIFFGSTTPQKFERKLQKKMPRMIKIMSVPDLFNYLGMVFG